MGLAKAVGKTKLLSKIKSFGDLPNLENLIKVLDDATDSKLISKLDELAKTNKTKLDNLNKHFDTFHKSTPSPFGKTDFNFKATNSVEFDGVKYVNGVETKISKSFDVDITFRYGFPQFQKTKYCPKIKLKDGTFSKYKYEVSNGLDFDKYSSHFKDANLKLLDDIGLTNSNKVNGYYKKGNYRWDGDSAQFELRNADGIWEKYTWHHIENGKTMIPVNSSVHSTASGGFKHAGGKSLNKKGVLDVFEFLGF